MKEFNYARAHRELAYPLWLALPEEVKALYGDIQQAYDGTRQLQDLSMPWLEGFKEKFDAISLEVLRHAQMVIHSLGHWDCRENHDLDFPRDKHGSYWKFEHLAKQSIIDREFGNGQVNDPWPKLDISAFMDHKEGTSYTNEEIAELLVPELTPEFTVVSVDNVNYRVNGASHENGHPFVIGRKHLQGSNMVLDPRCAPCDHCGHHYDAHVSDKVVFLKMTRNALDPEDVKKIKLNDIEINKIKGIEPLMTQHKVDGVVFVADKESQ